MRIFLGVMSIEAAIIGFFSSYFLSPQSGAHFLLVSDNLASTASLLLSVIMLIAGIVVCFAQKNDFFLFLAATIWIFGIILGMLFSPSFSKIYLRSVVCFLCLIISLFLFIDFKRKK